MPIRPSIANLKLKEPKGLPDSPALLVIILTLAVIGVYLYASTGRSDGA